MLTFLLWKSELSLDIIITFIQVSVGLFWLSLATINATALVKNWRIFRIFYNPEYKERVRSYSSV